jgi:hypothetical protein
LPTAKVDFSALSAEEVLLVLELHEMRITEAAAIKRKRIMIGFVPNQVINFSNRVEVDKFLLLP